MGDSEIPAGGESAATSPSPVRGRRAGRRTRRGASPIDRLADATVGCHFAQIRQDQDGTAREVGEFVLGGIKRAERVLIIASPERVKTILEALVRLNCDPAALQWSGQLAVLDAQWTLRHVMPARQPNRASFRQVIERAINRGPYDRLHRFRAYSELAGLLWHAGNYSASLELERYWDGLIQDLGFPLYCCFPVDRWNLAAYDSPFPEIGRVHQGVMTTDEDERFLEAVEAAGAELLGEVFFSTAHGPDGAECGLPAGFSRILNLRRRMPEACEAVLDRARRLFFSGSKADGLSEASKENGN